MVFLHYLKYLCDRARLHFFIYLTHVGVPQVEGVEPRAASGGVNRLEMAYQQPDHLQGGDNSIQYVKDCLLL